MNKIRKVPTWIGDLLLVITAVVWGGGFIGVAKSLDTLEPFYMIGIRFFIASILMVSVFWKKLQHITKEDILPGIWSGIFLFLGFAGQTLGAKYLSVGKLAFLTALNVLMVPFLALAVFKEHIKKHNIIAGLIAVVGFGFLNLTKDVGFNVGIGEVLAIGGAIFFAAQITALGHYSKKGDVCILAVIQMVVCCILGFACAFMFEAAPTQFDMEMLQPVAYLGVFSTFVAFLCQTIGQKYTSAARAAIILSLESVFGTLFSVIILKEVLTVNMAIGAILILLSVILAEYMHARGTT